MLYRPSPRRHCLTPGAGLGLGVDAFVDDDDDDDVDGAAMDGIVIWPEVGRKAQ